MRNLQCYPPTMTARHEKNTHGVRSQDVSNRFVGSHGPVPNLKTDKIAAMVDWLFDMLFLSTSFLPLLSVAKSDSELRGSHGR